MSYTSQVTLTIKSQRTQSAAELDTTKWLTDNGYTVTERQESSNGIWILAEDAEGAEVDVTIR